MSAAAAACKQDRGGNGGLRREGSGSEQAGDAWKFAVQLRRLPLPSAGLQQSRSPTSLSRLPVPEGRRGPGQHPAQPQPAGGVGARKLRAVRWLDGGLRAVRRLGRYQGGGGDRRECRQALRHGLTCCGNDPPRAYLRQRNSWLRAATLLDGVAQCLHGGLGKGGDLAGGLAGGCVVGQGVAAAVGGVEGEGEGGKKVWSTKENGRGCGDAGMMPASNGQGARGGARMHPEPPT